MAEHAPETHGPGTKAPAMERFLQDPLTIRLTDVPEPMETEYIGSEGCAESLQSGNPQSDGSQKDRVISVRRIRKIMCSVRGLCLAATRKYLREREDNLIVRRGGILPPRPALVSSGPLRKPTGKKRGGARSPHRPAPYLQRPITTGRRGVTDEEDFTDESPGPLLENISTICTKLWEQGQRDRLYVPRAERLAVQNMQHLLEWGDLVVLGREGVDLVEGQVYDGSVINPVLAAGKNLCRWLGYDEGVTWLEQMDVFGDRDL